MDDLISKLSEIRSEYNCFDENEEPYYRALSEAIKFLSRRADGDTVSREAVSEWLKQYGQDVLHGKYKFSLMYIWKNLMDLPSAQPEHLVKESGNLVNGLVNDCISRQAAIAHAVPLNLFGREVMMVSVGELENLPSVQQEIIYCKDCVKHNKGHGYYLDGTVIGIKDCCPLVEIRGFAQGHEFDYQYCAYAERRQDGTRD